MCRKVACPFEEIGRGLAGNLNNCGAGLDLCLGSSFVLPPSSLVPASALEGHQKLAGRATMTFPELILRSAGGGCAGGPRLLL